MEVRASNLSPEKREDIERAFEIAGLAGIEPICQMLIALLNASNRQQPFSAFGVAYVALYEETARLLLASVIETIAKDASATRAEMKEAVGCIKKNLDEWFADLLNTELDKVADFYDVERSKGITKQ